MSVSADSHSSDVPKVSPFPLGEENTNFSQYFTGRSWLAPLTSISELHVPIFNVTFEPGCRNNWQTHSAGQILVSVGGVGYYQERGREARRLTQGDVVEIPPNVEHWHGAAPTSWFAHLAIECNPGSNRSTWLERVSDEEYAAATNECTSAGCTVLGTRGLREDPELQEIVDRFIHETHGYGDLDDRTRVMVIMAAIIAIGATGLYQESLETALDAGLSPGEIKEVLYHAVPYVGLARVRDFLPIVNLFMTERGVDLPLEARAVVTPETRFTLGLELQKTIFGEIIQKMHDTAPENQIHIQRHLSANCFGDYQTRAILTTKDRELLTYAILVSMGGCEPQVKGHIAGNLNVGNSKQLLLAVTTQLLPYIGYPRTLNAIACLNQMVPEQVRSQFISVATMAVATTELSHKIQISIKLQMIGPFSAGMFARLHPLNGSQTGIESMDHPGSPCYVSCSVKSASKSVRDNSNHMYSEKSHGCVRNESSYYRYQRSHYQGSVYLQQHRTATEHAKIHKIE